VESLESKLDRLSPEERKEIEDFVDFLLSRSGKVYVPLQQLPIIPPVLTTPLPPLPVTEPASLVESGAFSDPGSPRTDSGVQAPLQHSTTEDSFHEIGGGEQDRINHDYMDYGQFEHHTSPATEAVEKVKRKIIAREVQDKPRHLLDWVD
jgi:hypothetical protein